MKTYYRTFPDWCRETCGRKLYRVALDTGMTCPNRDGTISKGGCIFCSAGGSGDFAIRYVGQKLKREDLIYNHQICADGDFIAYFQSFTNTYDSPQRLRFLFESAMRDPLFAGIAVATRPDCLSDEVIEIFTDLLKRYPDKVCWIELGLQTIHEKSSLFIRRGYPLSVFDDCAYRLLKAGIPFLVHVILGLPFETKQMMIETIEHINGSGAWGIKLQLLHYLSDTDLGVLYQNHPEDFHVLSEDEYVDIVCECIGNLKKDIVIHRLTGDGNGENLLAPDWSRRKGNVLNHIRHELKERNITQGCLCQEGNHADN